MIEDTLSLQDPAEVVEPVGQGRRHLAGVVLLGGSVRQTRFNSTIGRPLLDLPYRTGRSLLDEWCDQIAQLADGVGREVPLRILTDKAGNDGLGSPTNGNPHRIQVKFDRDPSEWRGTGGVLRDISTEYRPDELLLVANAGQFLLRPLSDLVAELDALGADIAVLAHRDGTPSTLMLVRCGCLKALPEMGFVDMKEQAIPRLTASHDVRVITLDRVATLGLRTAQSYLAALRVMHGLSNGTNGDDWRSAFTVVEDGARVEPNARLHDSVVLRGGVVGAGAVLVRSVVCRGGVVPAKAVVVDKLISSDGDFDAEEGRQ